MREIGSVARHGLAPCHHFAVRYALFHPGGRGGAIATVTAIWMIGGVGLAANLLGEPDLVPLWFLLTWLCGAAVAGYMTLFRRAAELRIDDDMVTAVYGFRSRRVGVSSLTRIRPGRGGGNVVVNRGPRRITDHRAVRLCCCGLRRRPTGHWCGSADRRRLAGRSGRAVGSPKPFIAAMRSHRREAKAATTKQSR